MPTIDQLAAATAAADTDELLVSQSGIARKVTRSQFVSGLQPELAVTAGSLLGRITAGTGSPEEIAVGANLLLANGTLTASALAFDITQLPAGTVPAGPDLLPISHQGTNASVSYLQFMSGLAGLSNVDASSMLVTPTGDTTPQKMADFAAETLPKAGGALTGSLTLFADPTAPLEAATKQYVDSGVATALPLTGGSLSGPLTLPTDPTASLEATTKQYVDAQISTAPLLPLAGGTLTGALILDGAPSAALQATTKAYVDAEIATALPLTGGSLSGTLTLSADPTSPLQAATKQYVDTQIDATALPLTGGTLSGPLVLSGDPAVALGAATKQYVDGGVATALPLNGGTLAGALTLAGNPTTPLQAAPKQYVDTVGAASVPLAGGTMTGPLVLSGDPAVSLDAATKQYVDTQVSGAVPITGGTLTGPLTLPGDPTAALQAAPKQYVDAAAAEAVPLTGGTMTGGLITPTLSTTGDASVGGKLSTTTFGITQTGTQTTTLPSQVTLQRNGSGPSDAPLVQSTVIVDHYNGAPLGYSNMVLTTTVNDATDSSGNFIDGTTSDVYAFISNLNVNSVRGENASVSASQHVAVTANATKNTPAGGYPTGRVGAEMWGFWLPVTDATGESSSVSGAVVGVEMDLAANNLDPGNRRLGYQFVLAEKTALTSGGYPMEWAYGIYFTTTSTSFYKWQIAAGGNYSIAVLDTRNAFPGTAKITTALTSPSTTIAVDQIIPFTSAGVYGQPVSATNTAQVKVGSTTYTLVGATPDGVGTSSGTLTFSTAVSVADGTLGTVVTGDTRTIWMATGHQIAFDYGGNINLFYDTSIGTIRLTAPFTLDGQLHANGGVVTTTSTVTGATTLQGTLSVSGTTTLSSGLSCGGTMFSQGGYTGSNMGLTGNVLVYGTGQFNGAFTLKGGLTVSGGPIQLPSYLVAQLPAATSGAFAFASNGCKPGEAAGAGTGVLVWGSGNEWLSIMSGTSVQA